MLLGLKINSHSTLSWCSRARAARLTVAASALLAAMGATAASAETLIDTLAQAYRYNPQLDAERARLRATDEDVSRANSGYRPNINATADIGAVKTNPNPGSSSTTEPKSYGVTLVQPIFRGFQVTNAVNAAEATVRAGREQLRLVEQNVLLDAVSAYGDVVRDQAIVRHREDNLRFLTQELKAAQDRFSVGEVTKTDVAQAQARKAGGQADLDLARANLKSSRAVYEQVVGSPPQGLREPNPNIRLLPSNLEEAIAIGTRENPQVVGALYIEQASRFQVDQVRGELLPDIQLEATYDKSFDNSGGTGFGTIDSVETTAVVGRLNVPLYANGGEVYARVRQAKHTHVSRLQEIEQARALAQSQVAQAWSQRQGFKARLQSDKATIQANNTALQGVREEEKVGQRTLLDVLDAQGELLLSQIQLEVTKRDLLVASYSVIAAIGRLNVAEVGAADSAYDPEVHYQEVRRKPWGIDITHDDAHGDGHDPWAAQVEHEPMK
jgi:outer membrane protein